MASPENMIHEMISERIEKQNKWLEDRGLDPNKTQTIYTEKGQKLYRYIADNNSKSILVSANDFGFEEIPYDKLAGCEIQNDGVDSNARERAIVFGVVSGAIVGLLILLLNSNYGLDRIGLPIIMLLLLCVALPCAIIGAVTAEKQVLHHRIAFLLNDPEMEYRTVSILKPVAVVGSADYLAAMHFCQNVRLSVLSIINSRGENKNG